MKEKKVLIFRNIFSVDLEENKARVSLLVIVVDPASAASSVASAGILVVVGVGLGPLPVHQDSAPAGAEQSSVASYGTRGQCPPDTGVSVGRCDSDVVIWCATW